MERKILNELSKWKDKQNRKPLILLGARQVGKTWAMKEFGRREFESVAYVNCDDEPLAKDLFCQITIFRGYCSHFRPLPE